MLRRTIAPFAFMILCWISIPSYAAEISCGGGVSPNCFRGYLNGQIRKGDYEEIAALLKDNHPRLGEFDLNSPGGDIDEAIKIGRLFRKYLISTVAPSQLPGGEIYSPWTDRSCTG